jgi:hypothetical protein
MGFFCYSCNKKVRGQPNNHGCTKEKYGKNANQRIYDHSGGKGHRVDRRIKNGDAHKNCRAGTVSDVMRQCYDFIRAGTCKFGDSCRFSHTEAVAPIAEGKGKGVEEEFALSGLSDLAEKHDASSLAPRLIKICYAFQKGDCKYGETCKFSHDL